MIALFVLTPCMRIDQAVLKIVRLSNKITGRSDKGTANGRQYFMAFSCQSCLWLMQGDACMETSLPYFQKKPSRCSLQFLCSFCADQLAYKSNIAVTDVKAFAPSGTCTVKSDSSHSLND